MFNFPTELLHVQQKCISFMHEIAIVMQLDFKVMRQHENKIRVFTTSKFEVNMQMFQN